MKYLDVLKEMNVFDFTNNSLEVEEVIFNKTTKKAKITLIIGDVLKIKSFDELKLANQKILKKMGVEIESFTVVYKNHEIDPTYALEYFEVIIDSLCKSMFEYKSFKGLNVSFDNFKFTIEIDKDSLFLNDYLETLKSRFKDYSLNVDFNLEVSDRIKTLAEINAQETVNSINKINTMMKEHEAEAKKAKELKVNKWQKKITVSSYSKINEIPSTNEQIFTYQEQNGLPNFMIKAEVFSVSLDKKKTNYLLKMHVFDETDGIIVNKWVHEDELEKAKQFKKGQIVNVVGKANYNPYQHEVTLEATSIDYVTEAHKDDRMDNAPVKRVELHIHTKMSNLDGLNEPAEFLKTGEKWGMPAMAFTDHNGVYGNSDIAHNLKGKNIKPLYGVELPFIDDLNYKCAFTNKDIPLRDATYIVFDIETTGFSQRFDRIIEIAAIKVKGGSIIDSYETFVNPHMPIPAKITELTSITDEMVENAPSIEEVMPRFLEFSSDAIMVAHNASFDMGMIKANIKRLGLPLIDFPILDTLNIFRAKYNKDVLPDTGVAKFNLKVLSKYFKVKQEHHHRAIDDTRVTAQCFIAMLQDLYQAGITNYNQVNSIIDPSNFYRYVIPSHINIISKTRAGLKNQYKLLSDALTKHCFGEARLLKSVLNQFREDNLVLSGCYKGQVFETALNRSEEEMREAISYCDIIEVQPPSSYLHLMGDYVDGDQRIEATIISIIKAAKEMGKLVVATSDAHYINKEDKKYRDILIASPIVGGGFHDLQGYKVAPDAHLRTTEEMLEEFAFLDRDLAYEIVVTNTNKVADMIENVKVFTHEMYAPRDDEFSESLGVPSIIEEMHKIVDGNMEKTYGTKDIHPIIQKRLDRELNSIISNGFSSTYYMAYLLVDDSMKNGYMVGSRGSVGSSFAATMMNITEINPLPPHYLCKKCKFVTFKMNEEEKKEYGLREIEAKFQDDLQSVESGYDLPDAVCPCCGNTLSKDGHDIPFETFLGFNGDKVPDIDLNFSGEYQAKAHGFIKKVFGVDRSFRAGTLATAAEKNAYGYVKAYLEKKNISLRNCEIARMAEKITGVKRSTGQHPGGIVVVPKYTDIFEVTPVQYPADNIENEWITTHYDYHSFEDNLLKLDCLGHDDPTLIRYFIDYVHEHQEDYPFNDATEIPVDDKNVYKMFSQTEIFGVTEEQIMSKVASYAVPEFGTSFVRQMLNDTMPKTFAQLVKISGLSHGTNVWLSNAQDLVLGKTEFGEIPFADIVGCRDDIMNNLIVMGCEPVKAFEIMEFVRKGKAKKDPEKWAKYKAYMEEHNVPTWYIWTCDRIEYLFPKAHATAYVLMALRIAWFKVYSPALFYSGWFSKRAKAWDVNAFLKGEDFIRNRIETLQAMPNKTAKDDDLITSLGVALEMTSRGLKFLPIDIKESDSQIFKVVDKKSIRIPFVAMDGLGPSAADSIKIARDEKEFSSKADVMKRAKVNKTLFDQFDQMGVFGALPEEDPEVEVGLFAFEF